jgi:GNAT superfamily N-acetyltransferase
MSALTATSPPTIRCATSEDLPDLVELLTGQYLEHQLHNSLASLEGGIQGVLAQPQWGSLLVAHREGRCLGVAYVAFIWSLEHGGRSLWLDELYVLPEARNSGLGSALMDAVIAYAKSENCMAIDLEVDEGHERAARLYERLGFRAHRRQRWYLPIND